MNVSCSKFTEVFLLLFVHFLKV